MIEPGSTSATTLVADLNPVQREAVLSPGGPLLILAGAGSGKTRVLTRRIAHLIRERGVAPGRILAVTFTNKAAGEMRDRVAALIAQPVRGLWIGTFHAIGLRWIRRHFREAGYDPNPSVFDEDDQTALLRRLLKAEGLEGQPRRVREVAAIISHAKNRAISPDELRDEARAPAAILAARIYTAYQAALRAQNALDFDDLLSCSLRLFHDHPDIADHYAEQFLHILVDEYQDTNHVQFRLVERLARAHRNIFVVGDDDQSIYGWRGADIRNILDFKRHFPDAVVHYMEQNYRSTRPILDFANAIVARNEGRWPKTLWTEREGGEAPELFLAADEDEEAEEISRRVRAETSNGRTLRDLAVFYRTHAQSRAVEDAFLHHGIRYILVGGVYFYQRREVKDLLAYLRLISNPRDMVSLRRALSVPRRGVGEQTIDALLGAAEAAGRDPLDLAASGFLPARGGARRQLSEFAALIFGMRARVSEPPELILSEIVAQIDYRRHLQSQGEDWEERAANVDELLEGARLWSSAQEGGVAEYLEHVGLMTSVDLLPRDADAITLMTVHNAKGLEFPVVFVTGLEEGIFPHISAFDDREEMEEERRLFYVACTRAKERLVLSASLLRRRWSGAASGLSRFLSEVPADLFTALDIGTDGEGGGWRSFAAGMLRARGGRVRESESTLGAGPPHAGDLDHPLVGRRVFHASFGHGIVVAADGEGERARIAVRFNSGETRKVIKSYLEWED